jgi:uncharacterized membrane protein (GlpM family)
MFPPFLLFVFLLLLYSMKNMLEMFVFLYVFFYFSYINHEKESIKVSVQLWGIK